MPINEVEKGVHMIVHKSKFICLLLVVFLFGCGGEDSETLLVESYQKEGRTWVVEHLRLSNQLDGYSYASFISSGLDGVATIVINKPYAGINWTGEEVDERWAARFIDSGATESVCWPDEDEPHYIPGESSDICYKLETTQSLGNQAYVYLLNNFNVLFTYGRFYAGGDFENDIEDVLSGLRYLENRRGINKDKIGIIGSSRGGSLAIYGTVYAPEAIKPSVTVAMSPLTDIPAFMTFYENELPERVDTQVYEHYTRFYDPYLRRLGYSDPSSGLRPDYLDYRNSVIASSVDNPLLVMHDDGDTILPANLSHELVDMSPEHIEGFWYKRMDQAPWQSNVTQHGDLNRGILYPAAKTISFVFIASMLTEEGHSLTVPFAYDDMFNFFSDIQQYQLEERDVSWLVPRLLEMANSQITFYDLTPDAEVPHVNGASFVAYWLNTIWETDLYTENNVKQLLLASGLPVASGVNNAYIKRLAGLDAKVRHKFVSQYESINDFQAGNNPFIVEDFYITPQEHTYLDDEGNPIYTDHTRHELSSERSYNGRKSHKAWITGESNAVIPGHNTNHRGYPTVQFHKTLLNNAKNKGAVNGVVFIEFWLWLEDIYLANEGDWLSVATLSSYADSQWPRTQLLNLDRNYHLHLMHVPDQGEKEQYIYENNLQVPRQEWVKLSLLVDYTENNSYHGPYIAAWQNETLVRVAKFNPRIEREEFVRLKYSGTEQAECLYGWDEHLDSIEEAETACRLDYRGGLSQLHLGLYAPPHLNSGVVYNDKLSVAQLSARLENDLDLDGVVDSEDNCTRHANADQRDTDEDGFGNRCDADVSNNFRTTQEDTDFIRNWIQHRIIAGRTDFSEEEIVYYNQLADLNGDNVANWIDIDIAASLQGPAPGPAAHQQISEYPACFAQAPAFDTPETLPDFATAPFSEDSFWKKTIPNNAIYEDVQAGILTPLSGDAHSQAPRNIDLDIVSVCYDNPSAVQSPVDIVTNVGYEYPYRASTIKTIGTEDNVQYRRNLSFNSCSSLTWKPHGNALFAIINPQTGDVDTGGAAWRCPGGPLLNYLNDSSTAHNNLINNIGTEPVPGRASELSPLGGLIREGELVTGINHAIAISLPQAMYYSDGTKDSTYVWPANNSDNSWNDGLRAYRGHDANYKMGSQLALPPGTVETLDLQTVAGRHIAQAAETYGMYIVDSSGVFDVAKGAVPTMTLAVEDRAALNDLGLVVSPQTGQNIALSKVDVEAFMSDIRQVLAELKIITNSGMADESFERFHQMSEALYDGEGTWGREASGYHMALRDSYWRADVYGHLSQQTLRDANLFAQRQEEVVRYLVEAQRMAGTGVFPFPADINNPEFGEEIAHIINNCPECITSGWIATLPGRAIEKLYYDHGYALTSIARYYLKSGNADVLSSIREAADWILDKPVSRNINYNSALIKGLSYAYRVTGDEKYRTQAKALHRNGVYPGFLSDDGILQAYANDAHNAKLEYHGFIVSGMIALASILETGDEFYEPLTTHLEMTVQHMLTRNLSEEGDYGETWPGTNLLAWYELAQFRDLASAEQQAVARIKTLINGYVDDISNETNLFRHQKALYSYFFVGLDI